MVSALVTDELQRRQDRLLERCRKQARFRDPERSLDTFDFTFNKKMNRALIYELATGRFIAQREDALFLGPPGVGKTHLAISLAIAAAESGRRVYYGTLGDLIASLEDAQTAGHLGHRLKTLSFPSLLVVDEIGFRRGALVPPRDHLEEEHRPSA